jgi:hypothetical protein
MQMGMEFEMELAIAVVEPHLKADGIWDLVIEHCPYCGKRHTHGGGSGIAPSLGRRLSHCHNGGYELKEART